MPCVPLMSECRCGTNKVRSEGRYVPIGKVRVISVAKGVVGDLKRVTKIFLGPASYL